MYANLDLEHLYPTLFIISMDGLSNSISITRYQLMNRRRTFTKIEHCLTKASLTQNSVLLLNQRFSISAAEQWSKSAPIKSRF